jgi:chromosome segregation ATPase
MKEHALRRTDVTDELLARRILALEERIERVEITRPPSTELILNTIAQLRADSANRFDRMDQRLDGVDRRLDGVERRLDAVETKVDALDSKVDALDSKVDALDSKVDALDSKVDALDSKVDALDGKVDQVITLLSGGSRGGNGSTGS